MQTQEIKPKNVATGESRGIPMDCTDMQAFEELMEILKEPFVSSCDKCDGRGVTEGHACMNCNGKGLLTIDFI